MSCLTVVRLLDVFRLFLQRSGQGGWYVLQSTSETEWKKKTVSWAERKVGLEGVTSLARKWQVTWMGFLWWKAIPNRSVFEQTIWSGPSKFTRI